MFNLSATLIQDGIKRLKAGYRRVYGMMEPAYAELIEQTASNVLHTIARSDALYHNVEHTLLVALVGQEMLRGKQHQENVSCRDWAEFIISLICHDVGYVKGVCRQDRADHRIYTTGKEDGGMVVLPPGATDASLTTFHVDRGKQFIQEILANQSLVDVGAIQHNIELTRFPIPADDLHRDTTTYAGLARAADLIGQLSDPRYLDKIPALFHELEEVGTAQAMGYSHPGDLRVAYPTFFHTIVAPQIQSALGYLQSTRRGRHISANLFANLHTVEQECIKVVEPSDSADHYGLTPFFQSLCPAAPVAAIA